VRHSSVDERDEAMCIRAYLEELTSSFNPPVVVSREPEAVESMAARVFDVITNRDFCYLSKSRAAMYRAAALPLFAEAIRRGDSIHLFYDIGGGYHATVRPGEEELIFDVGLAELLVLRQVADFASRVGEFYGGGVKFSLVIDNMCAHLVNDVPLAKTRRYCAALRDLIRNLGVDQLVDVLVESEHISVADFERERARGGDSPDTLTLTSKQHENVWRFLGRSCDEGEAWERVRRYREVIEASERLLTPLIHGVHLTQRATGSTLCFRPFRGGDSRIQCGLVALTKNNYGKLHPRLLTTSNLAEFELHQYRFPDLLPTSISCVTYAEPINRTMAQAGLLDGDASDRASLGPR
jgi:hypothetical protein